MLIDALMAQYDARSFVVLDPNESLWGSSLFGIPILGDDSLLPALVSQGAVSFLVGVGAIRTTEPRRRIFELGMSHNLYPVRVVHPAAILSPRAQIGAGTQLMPGSIVNAGARIDCNVILNTGAIVEHDCRIRDHAHVASGAVLAGGVEVGKGAHIGCGATIIQTISVGHGAVVGAGAVVVRDVAPYSTVVGVPARPIAPTIHE